MKVYKPKRTLQIIVAAIAAACLLFIMFAPYATVLIRKSGELVKEYVPGLLGGKHGFASVITALANGSTIWITLVIFAVIAAFVGVGTFTRQLSKFTGWVSLLLFADWIVMFAVANVNSNPFGINLGEVLLDVKINWVFWIGLPIVLALCVFAFIAQFSMHHRVSEDEDASWGEKAAKEAEKEREKKRAAELAEEAARKAANKK